MNGALETLATVTRIECGWIQTASGAGQPLLLRARYGGDDDLWDAMNGLGTDHPLAREIMGLGHHIAVPNLSRDGHYGLDAFLAAGFRWVVAVPLMTYRAHGILGVASRERRQYNRDMSELIGVVGGLIGTALSRANADRLETEREELSPAEKLAPPRRIAAINPFADTSFSRHVRRMARFKREHDTPRYGRPRS